MILDNPLIIEEFFPQKLAMNESFCNRTNEKKRLKANIQGVRPTLITSPRRYGKTSLGINVVENLKIPYSHLDLFPLADSIDVQNTLLSGIGDIISKIETAPTRAFKSLTEFFADLNLKFSFVGTKVDIEMARNDRSASKTILNALNKLDEVLSKKRKKAVLFLDEFQRLGQMPNSDIIEGALRHVAQKSKNIVFLFSGSNRHLLGKMFDDSTRPLYKLCDRLTLDRIDSKHYFDYLQKMSTRAWDEKLDNETIETILEFSQNHPYYVNVLCARLWRHRNIIHNNDVIYEWNNYAIEEKSTVFKELEGLSANQYKLLIALSRPGYTSSPLGDKFLRYSGLAISSARQSLVALLDKDYILKDKTGRYKVLDPLIHYVLCERPM